MQDATDLHSAIAALWNDARPRLRARVDALESAASGPFEAADRASAQAEAHALAGTLGTFGRADGTEAARAAERALETGDREALVEAVRVLRAVI